MNYDHSEHFSYPTEEEVEILLDAIDAVNALPDGKEIIGKGHIICHSAWYKNRAETLSFAEAAKRYCPGKSKNAAITVWNGRKAVTFTQESDLPPDQIDRIQLPPEQVDRIQRELNSWLTSHGYDSLSVLMA